MPAVDGEGVAGGEGGRVRAQPQRGLGDLAGRAEPAEPAEPAGHLVRVAALARDGARAASACRWRRGRWR